MASGRGSTAGRVARLLLAVAALGAAALFGRLSAPRPAREDPASLDSFRSALEERDWVVRSYRLHAFLQGMGPDELPEALEAFEGRRQWLGQDEIRAFMMAWTRFDAPAAFERALSWPGRSRRTAAGAAIYAWGFHDPEAATRAHDGVADTPLRDFLRTRLVSGWARGEHRESANRYIASLPEGAQRDSFAGMLARELNEEGADAVIRWAESTPEVVPSYKETVFRKACAALAATDPEAAVRFASAHAGRSYAAGSTGVIAGRWANLDPRAALAWLVTLPAGAERDAAVTDAFGRWLTHSRMEAEEWLRGAIPAAELDPAVRVLVRRTNQEGAPEEAVGWAQRISAPQLRDEVIVAFGRAWLRREPVAADSWLARSGLPETVRASIQQPAPKAGAGGAEAGDGR
jgi:hypothetical protein